MTAEENISKAWSSLLLPVFLKYLLKFHLITAFSSEVGTFPMDFEMTHNYIWKTLEDYSCHTSSLDHPLSKSPLQPAKLLPRIAHHPFLLGAPVPWNTGPSRGGFFWKTHWSPSIKHDKKINRTFSGTLGRVERQVHLWGHGKRREPSLQSWTEANWETRIPVQWTFADMELIFLQCLWTFYVKVIMNRLKNWLYTTLGKASVPSPDHTWGSQIRY